ncbi:MAG: hypothetical protein V1816_16655 [Pseudomonadota bacterium]
MKKIVAILAVVGLMMIGPGAAQADELFGNGTWLGPDAKDMTKDFHEGTPIAREKSHGFLGPDAKEMAESYQTGTPTTKSAATDFFGYPKGDPNYTAF